MKQKLGDYARKVEAEIKDRRERLLRTEEKSAG